MGALTRVCFHWKHDKLVNTSDYWETECFPTEATDKEGKRKATDNGYKNIYDDETEKRRLKLFYVVKFDGTLIEEKNENHWNAALRNSFFLLALNFTFVSMNENHANNRQTKRGNTFCTNISTCAKQRKLKFCVKKTSLKFHFLGALRKTRTA
ncbi:CLUMA_CG019820, isoform A [Clunio marinus]|uniref:CLUMA_CG019820, isoform A n=1 Tax=Clunio marinus TaxID=568069 RepID=A0A1J1J2F7_9DIPT|nr:CLUMA_CG019820, isoform A [Clunio marinus]